ncbi:MAG TPA: YigZ family protein [Arcobacter sp.]|jgi:uncharacterized YigZ family protein|nr:YigZ family protein [Arcobacter sp.]
MQFIKEEFTSTLEIKKSKFIAHLCPYDQFDTMMKRLKEKHPKARHFVYAYRYLNEFDQIVENSSDDGEPKGTSGKPSLKALSGADLINCGIVIVRYFGGIRLGTGGLVRAYSDAVNEVCEVAQTFLYEKLETKKLVVEYTNLSKVEYTINQLNIKIKEKLFDSDVTLILEATKERLDELEIRL